MNNETFQSYDGVCSLNNHALSIMMLDSLTSITFEFSLNEKNQTSLKRASVTITIDKNSNYFPNSTTDIQGTHVFLANESLFNTDCKNSYRCNSKTVIGNFKADGNLTIKSIDLEHLRVQPFVDNQTVFNNYAVGRLKQVKSFSFFLI